MKAKSLIRLWSPYEITQVRRACQTAAHLLHFLGQMVKPGITTLDLDQAAIIWAKERGIRHAPLGYMANGSTPFPKSICTSVNNVVCHGIPAYKPLKDGDIVNIDVTPIVNGWYGDTSATFKVGSVDAQTAALVDTTKASLMAGIDAANPGATLGDIGAAIQAVAEAAGFSVVKELVGHGLGRHFHTAPIVYHWGEAGKGMRLRPGMIFTIEPMINAGSPDIQLLDDDWTIVTADNSHSAQFEHTVLITEDGAEVLTTLNPK